MKTGREWTKEGLRAGAMAETSRRGICKEGSRTDGLGKGRRESATRSRMGYGGEAAEQGERMGVNKRCSRGQKARIEGGLILVPCE